MKRIDLSFQNEVSDTEEIAAVQRVTFTSPQQFIGKLRVTRFKLTEGAFPLALIKPSTRPFTAAEKAAIDAHGYTPTDIAWGTTSASNTQCTGIEDNYYMDPSTTPPTFNAVSSINGADPFNGYIKFATIFIREAPRWNVIGTDYYLANESKFIYQWSDLNNPDKFLIYQNQGNGRGIFVTGNETEITFHSKSATQYKGTAPQLFLSQGLHEIIFGTPISPLFSFRLNAAALAAMGDGRNGFNDDYYFQTPHTHINWNSELQGYFSSGQAPPPGTNWSVNADYIIKYEFSKGTLLYPFTCLYVIIDELNFSGETVVTNSKQSTGVINPSSLSIVKSYLVGISGAKSDFVVVDDLLSQVPLDVNVPNLYTLTIRLALLLSDNSLRMIQLPPHEGFFIQLSLNDH